MMPVASCVPFPFSAPCNDMLTMLVCANHWLYMHLCTLACKSCLLICLPCFTTMKLWVFDPNLHLSFANSPFCLLSCLFAFSLVCLHSYFFACQVYHVYLLYASFICSLHLFLPLLVCWFLVFALHVHTWSEDAWSLGTVSQVQAKRAQMRACRDKPSGSIQ